MAGLQNRSAQPKRAVLFDFDGIIVNSEEIAYRDDHNFLRQFGLEYTREEYIEMTSGITYEAMLAKLEADCRARNGHGLPADFGRKMNERYQKLMETELQPIPGVVGVLDGLKRARIPFAIATNGSLPGTMWKLEKVGLAGYFNDRVYSKDMVPNPKPAPDVYQFAAHKLGVDPRECFVVEDSVTGVTAGVAAGASVVGYAGGTHRLAGYGARLKAAGAAHIVDHMNKVRHILLNNLRPGPQPRLPQP